MTLKGNERVDPTLFQAILLDELVRNTRRMIELEEIRIPRGKLLQLAATIGTDRQTINFPTPVFSVSIINDGPGTITYQLNDPGDEANTLLSGLSDDIEFPTGVIKRLYLVASAASGIRIKATY